MTQMNSVISLPLTRLKEDEQRFILNLEVQLLLKQGQIEVDAGPFIRDFRQSVLVHRSVVEDLNNTIKVSMIAFTQKLKI